MNPNELNFSEEDLDKIKDAIKPQLMKVIAENAKTLWYEKDGALYPYSCMAACIEVAITCAAAIAAGKDDDAKCEIGKKIVQLAVLQF